MEALAELHYGEYLEFFNLEKIETKKLGRPEEFKDESVIIFREKDQKQPNQSLIKNGYLNPLELIDYPVSGKAVYLKFYRRRWKDSETGREQSNEYTFQFPGTKLTKRFGLFLKDEDRDKVHQLLSALPYFQDKIEEDIRVVQKSSVRI